MRKMIIKERSPTMGHVSRTHRVALDWLFHRINLDSKIQIRYVDTKNQLADMLIKSNFTRDEWSNLLHLFHITSNTTFTRSHFFLSNRKQAVMSKRAQESCSSDSPTVKAKSRPMNIVSHQCLSMRQNSGKMSSPTNPVSTGTESVSASSGKPVQTNTSKSSMLCSQVRLQGNAVDPEHPEQGSSPASFGNWKQVSLFFWVRVLKVKWVQNILEGSLTRQPWETACWSWVQNIPERSQTRQLRETGSM